jgi:hypothetical protein
MVEVASRRSSNPVSVVGNMLNIPAMKSFPTMLDLPIKLIFPNFKSGRVMMLGLGDIALPGMLVSYALRCDTALSGEELRNEAEEESGSLIENGVRLASINGIATRETKPKLGDRPLKLFQFSLVSYCIGLSAALLANFLSGHAQPALLYLVPAVVGTLAIRAWYCRAWQLVWLGSSTISIVQHRRLSNS